MLKNRRRLVVLILTIAFAARGLFLILSLPVGDPLDELFHVGYAEYLARTGRIPDSTSQSMPAEDMRLTANLPRTTAFGGPKLTFTEYMAIPREDQRALRKMTFAPVPEERDVFLGTNYESQQPPLMYLIGAAVLHAAGSWINVRFFALRLIAVIFAACTVPLAYIFFRRLFAEPAALGATVAYVAFPGPGTFTSRFTNDALALPLAAAAIILLADAARGRLTLRKTIALAVIMALGCWTKLYFLVFLPAVPVAALFSPREARLQTLKRAMAASVVAFALIVPWMVRQYRDTGDWLGLAETKAAAHAGIGIMPRIEAIPRVLRPIFITNFWRTFVYPGTWSRMGGEATTTRLTLAGLVLLLAGPLVFGGPASKERMRRWGGAAVALFFFALAQIAHLTTFTAVGMSAGAEGWYSLILLPVVLAAAAAFGKSIPLPASIAASVLFLAAECSGTFGVLRSIYSGGAKLGLFEVFTRVGVVETPEAVLAALTAVWLLALAIAPVLVVMFARNAAVEADQVLSTEC